MTVPGSVTAVDPQFPGWPNGPGALVFVKLFEQMKAGDLGPLDLGRVVFRGWSGGAQMVSCRTFRCTLRCLRVSTCPHAPCRVWGGRRARTHTSAVDPSARDSR